MSSDVCLYGLKLCSRALCALEGPSPSAHRFLVGTCSARDDNELQILEYSEEEKEVKCVGFFEHPNECWDIKSTPFDASLCSTVHISQENQWGATLWRLPVTFPAAADEEEDEDEDDDDHHSRHLKSTMLQPQCQWGLE